GWHPCILSMLYFLPAGIIAMDIQLRLCSMHTGWKAVPYYGRIVTAECGLPAEFPRRGSMCTAQETWYGSLRTDLPACGLANRRTGNGFGSNGRPVIDHSCSRILLLYGLRPLRSLPGSGINGGAHFTPREDEFRPCIHHP